MRFEDPVFLGIDTSTRWRSVGISAGNGHEVSLNWNATRAEERDLLPKIEELLASEKIRLQDLSGIAVTIGPGSFTALRVGVSVAQGLGMGLEIPVVPVGSLEPFPHSVGETLDRATVLLPARSGEVFVQTYSRQEGRPWTPENVVECLTIEDAIGSYKNPGIWIGPGLFHYDETIAAVGGNGASRGGESTRVSRAGVVARLGRDRWKNCPDGFSPESVAINYHQSHGALTIAQRKGDKNHV